MNRKDQAIVAGIWLVAALLFGFLFMRPAEATNDGVCIDNGTKVDVVGNHHSITVTAPAGFKVYEFCVKAGSIKQGEGPEVYVVDPPAAQVTITHSSGKDISHYTVSLVIDPEEETCETNPELCPPTTTVPPTTAPPTTAPPVTTTPVPSTTVPVQVSSTVVTAEPTPSPTVAAPEVLAYTGRTSRTLAGIGFALVLLGAALFVSSRKLRAA